MGLKQDLIDAKVKAARDTGIIKPLDTSNGSFIEREAEYTKEAIAKFLTQAEFRITRLNAPVVVEKFKIPEQLVNIELETLLGEALKDVLNDIVSLIPSITITTQLGPQSPMPTIQADIQKITNKIESITSTKHKIEQG